MSEVNTPPAGEQANTPPVEASGLPSDTAAAAVDPFAIPSDRVIDGKLDGKWDSFDTMNKSYNEIVDAYGKVKSENADTSKEAVAIETAKTQHDGIMGMLPEYMENGMQLTEEMTAKATEMGIDPRDLKIGAMEMSQRIEAAHAVVGGTETYNAMISDMGEVMSDAQKASFDKDVTGGMGEYAIKGLHAAWLQKTGRREVPKRITGEQPRQSGGVRPYASMEQMRTDMAYLNTQKGRNDTAAQKQHLARRNATPDSVIFG